MYTRETLIATGVLMAYLNQWYISTALYTIKMANAKKRSIKSNVALIIVGLYHKGIAIS